MEILYTAFEAVMNGCYALCNNYGAAIVLFTLISKIVLLPVSVWVQKNSIKMVKMQPEINFIIAKHFGDKDTIAEKQAAVYKREKYSPMASVIPLIIQLVLLMCVIEVIRRGMDNPAISMDFFGIDLSLVPSVEGVSLIWPPLLAGVSAWILCIAQNAGNVLQAEQSNLNKYGLMAFSVALSLYLGWFVPVGVAIYWTASNIFAIILLYALNLAINPKNYVDYEALEKSKKELESLGSLGGKKRRRFNDPEAKRERQDYKRFFSIVNKHLVFYSESSGFYKYYKGFIEYILDKTNMVIHYITSDPGDIIFELAKKNERIKPYYIGEKRLITLMMKLEADMMVMTMPDLENYHIKRSYIDKNVEYVNVQHGMDSLNLMLRTAALDHYDTIFCCGKHHKEEVEKMEAVYKLPKKELVECGYPLLDEMRADYEKREFSAHDKKRILIAPSWQDDNIVDSCLEKILDNLKGEGYYITVRPHPQHVRHRAKFMEQLKVRYKNDEDIEIQIDFSSNSTVFEADLLITDWSSIAYEYAYTTRKPVLFVNTPMKVMNPEYKKIDTVPLNILVRDEIGCSLNVDELDKLSASVKMLLDNSDEYYEKIDRFVDEYVYNLGTSAKVGAEYIISRIQKKINEKKGEQR